MLHSFNIFDDNAIGLTLFFDSPFDFFAWLNAGSFIKKITISFERYRTLIVCIENVAAEQIELKRS
jgi:hypothetical protein